MLISLVWSHPYQDQAYIVGISGGDRSIRSIAGPRNLSNRQIPVAREASCVRHDAFYPSGVSKCDVAQQAPDRYSRVEG